METFEELYRIMQDFEDAMWDDGTFLATLSEREKMFAGRVASIGKRIAYKIEES